MVLISSKGVLLCCLGIRDVHGGRVSWEGCGEGVELSGGKEEGEKSILTAEDKPCLEVLVHL